MSKYAYSPDTGELIRTETPADWMGVTSVAPPAFNSATAGCFWRENRWEIVQAHSALAPIALAMLPGWEATERAAGIDHAGRRWLTTPAALQDIRDALMAEAAPPGGVWIDAARQPVSMTLADLKALWGAIFVRGDAIYRRRFEMEQAIATMTRAELESFKPGWPAPKP